MKLWNNEPTLVTQALAFLTLVASGTGLVDTNTITTDQAVKGGAILFVVQVLAAIINRGQVTPVNKVGTPASITAEDYQAAWDKAQNPPA